MTSEHHDRAAEPDPERDPAADEGVRVTDRRRIDPETGEVRPPADGSESGGAHSGPESTDPAADVLAEAEAALESAAADQIAELTNDLQRLAAEYRNYRTRTQRELADARVFGRIEAVSELIGTLDDLDRAAEHGDLTGPTLALAENLRGALERLGVERFGTVGEAFNPAEQEALTHTEGEGLAGPTVTAVYQPGYRLGDRVIRPARVGVTE